MNKKTITMEKGYTPKVAEKTYIDITRELPPIDSSSDFSTFRPISQNENDDQLKELKRVTGGQH